MKRSRYFILILIFINTVIWSYPKQEIGCKEDYWVKKILNSQKKVVVSSIHKPEGKYKYSPENLLDNNLNTCWCPRKNKNNGIDEFIIMKIPYGSKGFKIVNGAANNQSVFKKNNRVRKIYLGWINLKLDEYDMCKNTKYSIVFQTIPNEYHILKDSIEAQIVKFSDIKDFEWSRKLFKDRDNVFLIIGIVDIYKGTKYNDTCISEIEIIK